MATWLMSRFNIAEALWLGMSTAVDIVLSVVLSSELWWARRKLAEKGGNMREVMNRLIVTSPHLRFCSMLISVAGHNAWRSRRYRTTASQHDTVQLKLCRRLLLRTSTLRAYLWLEDVADKNSYQKYTPSP